MVKVYKQDMPRSYTYEKAGTYTVKIAGNLKSAAFSGNGNNGLAQSLVEVSKLDKNIEALEDNAFFACAALKKVNLSSSSVKDIGNQAFFQCTSLQELTCSTEVEKMRDNCFDSCTSLTSVSPASYERDMSSALFAESSLSSVGSAAFANTQSLKCLVVPSKVKLEDSIMLAEAPSLQHVILRGMTEDSKDAVFSSILQTSMFGLSSSCTFEGSQLNEVYQYVHSQVPNSNYIQQLSASDGQPMTSYFSLKPSSLPETFDGLKTMTVYSYSSQYVQHCLDSSLDFMVLYIDSKTSAKSKLFMMMQDADTLLFNAKAKNALLFLLDRHDPSSGQVQNALVNHYKQSILQKIANKQALIHTSTDPLSIVDFPEVSLVSKNGIKYQKVSLDVSSYSKMKAQLESAAGNVFS